MGDTIDEYISEFLKDIQEKLEKIRKAIQETTREASEKISYGMPTFYLNSNLVHFAAFKKHIGFYPVPSGIGNFKDELSEYKTFKGTIQFPFDEKIPYNLIKEIVKFRVMKMKIRKKLKNSLYKKYIMKNTKTKRNNNYLNKLFISSKDK